MLQDESGRLKVTDFGLSKINQQKDLGYKMTGRTGSCKRRPSTKTLVCPGDILVFIFVFISCNLVDRYMAPEVYRRELYGKAVDVFSFSLIVFEVNLNETSIVFLW